MSIFPPIPSSIGDLFVCIENAALIAIRWEFAATPPSPTPSTPSTPPAKSPEDQRIFEQVHRQLDEYFARTRQRFELPLAPRGSAFQQRAWQALLEIPYGHTCSYKEQAQKLGQASASRAVGTANAKNPIPIVIPCHRVIGSDGSLTGYAGGLRIKQKLLELEGARSIALPLSL